MISELELRYLLWELFKGEAGVNITVYVASQEIEKGVEKAREMGIIPPKSVPVDKNTLCEHGFIADGQACADFACTIPVVN